mgnify:CR=1 FL=1
MNFHAKNRHFGPKLNLKIWKKANFRANIESSSIFLAFWVQNLLSNWVQKSNSKLRKFSLKLIFWTKNEGLEQCAPPSPGIARSFAFQVGFFLEISAKNGNIFVKNENDGFKSWKFYFWCQVEWKGAVEQIFEFMNFWWWQRAYHRYWRILHFLNLKIFKINWLFYLHILILASDDLGGRIWGHLNSCFRVGCFCLMKKIIISSEDFLLGWALFSKIGIPILHSFIYFILNSILQIDPSDYENSFKITFDIPFFFKNRAHPISKLGGYFAWLLM